MNDDGPPDEQITPTLFILSYFIRFEFLNIFITCINVNMSNVIYESNDGICVVIKTDVRVRAC